MSDKQDKMSEKKPVKGSQEESDDEMKKQERSQLSTSTTMKGAGNIQKSSVAEPGLINKAKLKSKELKLRKEDMPVVDKGSFLLDNKNARLGKRDKVKSNQDPSDNSSSSDSSDSGDDGGEEDLDLADDEDQTGQEDTSSINPENQVAMSNSKNQAKKQKRQYEIIEEKSDDEAKPEDSNKEDSSYKPPAGPKKDTRSTRRTRRDAGQQPQDEESQPLQEEEYREIDVIENVLQHTTGIGAHADAVISKLDIISLNQTCINTERLVKEKTIENLKKKIEPLIEQSNEDFKGFLNQLMSQYQDIMTAMDDSVKLAQRENAAIRERIEQISSSSREIAAQIKKRAGSSQELKDEIIEKMQQSAKEFDLKFYNGKPQKGKGKKLYLYFDKFLVFCTTWVRLYCDIYGRDPILCKPCNCLAFASTDKNRFETADNLQRSFSLREVINLFTPQDHKKAEERFIGLLFQDVPSYSANENRTKYMEIYLPQFQLPGTDQSKAVYHKCPDEAAPNSAQQAASPLQSKAGGSSQKTPSKVSNMSRPASAVHQMSTRSQGTSLKKNTAKEASSTINVVKKSATASSKPKKTATPVKSASQSHSRRQSPRRSPAPQGPPAPNNVVAVMVERRIEHHLHDNLHISSVELRDKSGITMNVFAAETVGSVIYHLREHPQQPPN